jgi:hypothetical protein
MVYRVCMSTTPNDHHDPLCPSCGRDLDQLSHTPTCVERWGDGPTDDTTPTEEGQQSRELETVAGQHTPTPWKWEWHDTSVLALYGPGGLEEHVLWCGICPACQERGGRCTAPTDANADHIVRCVNAHAGLVAALERIAGKAPQGLHGDLRIVDITIARKALADARGE